jgi:hypothetical protein
MGYDKATLLVKYKETIDKLREEGIRVQPEMIWAKGIAAKDVYILSWD